MGEIAEVLGDWVSQEQLARLTEFLALIRQWNPSHGLLAKGELPRLVDRHLVDSVSLVPFLPGHGVGVDLGSGNGFPGLVAAILSPHLTFHLTEANQKKCRFLRFALHRLGLANVILFEGRLEGFPPTPIFQFATSRAFASLVDNARFAYPILSPGSPLLAMKGFHVEHEISVFLTSPLASRFSPPVIHEVSRQSKIISLAKI